MKLMLRRSPDQVVYYDQGVGTAKGEAVRGGAFGWGLSAKVLNGYLWLMENYEDRGESPRGVADQIFLFGFSRGAFTARSLAGFLSLCGILRKDSTRRIRDAFEISRIGGLERDHEEARRFRNSHGRDVSIELLGVWDTVGALGDPRLIGRVLEDARHHKVKSLPPIVRNAVHALAIDEHRLLFEPTLWPGAGGNQFIEQRWFVGSHANVGGGYDRDGLFLRPLQWMQSHAVRLGLEFGTRVWSLSEVFDTSFPRDPLNEIGYGAYYLTHLKRGFRRFDREVTLGGPSCETLDHTVLEKWAWSESYRPASLKAVLEHDPRAKPPSRRLEDAQILDLLPAGNWELAGERGFSLRPNP